MENMALTMQDNLLWQYSLTVYRRADVEPLLIALQNRYSADVNILLCCGWLGSQGQSLSVDNLQQLIDVALPWQQRCVKPLRAIRQFLKGREGDKAFREQLKALEIDAECHQQRMIYQQIQTMTLSAADPATAIIDNLARYASQLAIADQEGLLQDLADLAELIK